MPCKKASRLAAVPLKVRAVAVPPTVTEPPELALSVPLLTPRVSTRSSSPAVLPSSRSAPVITSKLALSGVIIKLLGSALITGAVAVPLLPKGTAATTETVAWRVLAACTKLALITCTVAVSA